MTEARHEVSLGFTPYPHQRSAHAALLALRFLVLVWHRRAGKTVFAVMELVLGALACKRERGRYGYIAPFLKQAKGVAWDYLKAFARQVPGTNVNEAELWVEFPNGARVRLFGADNADALRGLYFDGVVLDEVADMRPDVWGQIVRPALADRQGWAIFIGTAKGINLLSELYYQALKAEGWHAEVRRASETGVIPQEELAELKRTLSAAQYSQELDCDFAAAVDNVLIRLDDVLTAQARTVGEEEVRHYPKVLGVDVARYGDDWTVIQPRQGPVAMPPRRLKSMDTMEVAGNVAMAIDRWQPDKVFVDAGGVGGGVVDRLLQLGHAVVGVEFGAKPRDARFENSRAEMWWTMGEWVRAGGCLPNDAQYAAELPAPTFTYANARGRFQLETKDDMRKRGLPSPDVADALAVTFAFPVPMRGLALPRHLQKESRGEYDPYATREETPPMEGSW